jgi:enoyl-CoA hydratase/carnithine racemase
VVTGAGPAFSAGFDLKDQADAMPQGVAQCVPLLEADFKGIMSFWNLSKPSVAAVNGPALAGGYELMLGCDMSVASETATFGEPELKFGAGIVAMLLPWVAGPKIAKEIIYLGIDRGSAARAREIGMVNRVVPGSELDDIAFGIAKHIAAVDPKLIKETKRAINRAFEAQNMLQALEEALAIDLGIEGPGSPDKTAFMDIARRDGLKAALAWRDGRFQAKA